MKARELPGPQWDILGYPVLRVFTCIFAPVIPGPLVCMAPPSLTRRLPTGWVAAAGWPPHPPWRVYQHPVEIGRRPHNTAFNGKQQLEERCAALGLPTDGPIEVPVISPKLRLAHAGTSADSQNWLCHTIAPRVAEDRRRLDLLVDGVVPQGCPLL